MRFEKILISLLIILSPLYIIRFKIFSIPTTFLEILILFTLILWLIGKVRSKEFAVLKILNLNSPLSLFAVSLVFIVAIQVLASAEPIKALGIFKAYIIEPILIYYVIIDVIRRSGSWQWIVKAFALSAIWIGALSLIQFVTGGFTLAPNELKLGRVTALYNSANAIGLYLGPIFFVLLAQFKTKRFSLKDNFLELLALFLITITIFLSRSKGTLISVTGVLSIFLLIKLYESKARTIIISFFLFFVIGTLMVLSIIHHTNFLTPKVETENYQKGNTLQIRFYLWKGALALINDHPLFGSGLNGFRKEHFQNYRLAQYDEPLQYPHNLILNFWTELGFLGFSWLILLYYYIFINKNFIFGSDKKQKIGIIGICMAFIYLLLHGIVDVPFFKNDLALQFWILLSLISYQREVIK